VSLYRHSRKYNLVIQGTSLIEMLPGSSYQIFKHYTSRPLQITGDHELMNIVSEIPSPNHVLEVVASDCGRVSLTATHRNS